MQAAAAPPDASQVHARAKARPSALKNAPAASPPQAATLPPSETAGPVAPAPKPIARPATIILKNGMLTVKADNSDLGQILKAVAQASGMVLDGSVRSTPVYGVYGPLDPRAVLTDLLTGSGYNFIMVGVGQQGVPRELRLTLQSGGPSPGAPTPAAAEPGSLGNSIAIPPQEEELGPGAIEHVPPAPSEDPQERMQQNLQRLQQMQDKQSQQQPPQ